MKWRHLLAVLVHSFKHYMMLTIQGRATDSERGSRISCAVTFCIALKTGHFKIRLDFTERVNQVLHSK